MSAKYQILPPTAPVAAPQDLLEAVVRSGAQQLLQAALEAEVEKFLGRARYQRVPEFRGFRNGHLPRRTVGVGMGAVEGRVPRVRDVPREVAPGGFESAIVHRYERRSEGRAIHPFEWAPLPQPLVPLSILTAYLRPYPGAK